MKQMENIQFVYNVSWESMNLNYGGISDEL